MTQKKKKSKILNPLINLHPYKTIEDKDICMYFFQIPDLNLNTIISLKKF
jgi:hypothetical protein